MTITRQSLTQKLHEKLNISLEQAQTIVENIINEITETIAAGEEVKITNFGTFSINHRPARTGINPHTGEKIQLEASKTPIFRASSKVKTQLQPDNKDDDFITSFL